MVHEELVRHIASNLVNEPDAIETTVRESDRSLIVELRVAPDDMGRVIGKNGRVADAVRSLLRASARGTKKHIVLEIE